MPVVARGMSLAGLFILAFAVSSSTLSAQTFTGSFDLVATQQYPNGNERSDTISYYFGGNMTAILIYGRRNDPDMRMVFNQKDTTITSLYEMNGKKGGFILPMDELHWPGMPQAFRPIDTRASSALNFTRKEKTIEGYNCKEVLAENDDYSATLWIAEDIPLSMTHVLSYQSVGKGKSNKETELFDQFGIDGLPLEMILKSKKEKADVTMHLVNFKEPVDEAIFSTEGHSLSKVE